MTIACEAEFPMALAFIYGTADCDALEFDIAFGGVCETATLSRVVPAGTYIWAFVAAFAFATVPCETEYILTLDGIAAGPECAPNPTQEASWGRVKSIYRQR